MERVHTLIVGAGISGLATAAALGPEHDYLVLEADTEIGGYCKTITRDGFVWDYSGHFFHFKHPEIEAWLRERMPGQRVLRVRKRSAIRYAGRYVDYPFQKNIHQLPQDEFIDCLHDLYFARAPLELLTPEERAARECAGEADSFEAMLYAKFGRAIAEKFLVPYNEKLYATKLSRLDIDAMGRFFPHADLSDVVRNMKRPDNASYNTYFTYPEGGAIQYVRALASAVTTERIAVSEPVVAIDLAARVARTPRREVRYEQLVSSAPFDRLLRLCGVPHDASVFTSNKVLVFNLGFDGKGPCDQHWVYYPSRETIFYRVGFYDNIFDADRMSLYVEIGLSTDASVDVDATRERVLSDLRREGVIDRQRLVAWHHVVMDPAYVHITRASIAETARLRAELRARGVHSIGRYGGWTYCSIEDNIVEARALAAALRG
jgi:protoporphyrinogen oxidase